VDDAHAAQLVRARRAQERSQLRRRLAERQAMQIDLGFNRYWPRRNPRSTVFRYAVTAKQQFVAGLHVMQVDTAAEALLQHAARLGAREFCARPGTAPRRRARARDVSAA